MSFPAFKFNEIVKEKWDESEIKESFLNTKFMFVIFQKKNGEWHSWIKRK